MGEDAKIQTVSNDLRRRLLHNSEAMGAGSKKRVVDQYAQKLRNSGYEIEQVRRIIFNGIKGYENKRRRSNEMGWKLHRTSLDSMGARVRKKLLAKSSWFKKRRKTPIKEDTEHKNYKRRKGGQWEAPKKEQKQEKELKVKTVLFVEQSSDGSLAKRMREVLRSMEPALGFRIKVVERTGQTLGSKFSLSSLWEGTKCGRGGCTTCEQGAEELPPCSMRNLLYENICAVCNPGAPKKGELITVKEGAPSLYVGETSRTIFERALGRSEEQM